MTLADRALLVLAAALIGGLFAAHWSAAVVAHEIEVYSGTRSLGRYALNEARRIEVPGRVGLSVIEVRDQRARFTAGPCRNRVCIRTGWLEQAGATAACIPNGVILRLHGGPSDPIDAFSF